MPCQTFFSQIARCQFTWNGQAWQVRSSRTMASRRAPAQPETLRLNSYCVLLSRRRDGMVIMVLEHSTLDETFEFFRSLINVLWFISIVLTYLLISLSIIF